MTTLSHESSNVAVLPRPTGTVTPITKARSFGGTRHRPDWAHLSIVCFGVDQAVTFAHHLGSHGYIPDRDADVVSLRLDRHQPSTRRVVAEVAFVAASLDFASTDEIFAALAHFGL